MAATHPETELVPYLRGGLSAGDRVKVEHHLAQCAQCRASAHSATVILSRLAEAVDDVPEPDWTRYRAELRQKLRTAQAEPVGLIGRWRRIDLRLPAFGWASATVGAAAVAVLAIALVMHRG